jgi:hypothetical protein
VGNKRIFRSAVLVLLSAVAACSPSGAAEQTNPGLANRGTTMTTVKPARQDLANRVSLSGKVTMSPVFGLVAPVAGQVRFLNVSTPTSTPTRPTRVANVVASGRSHPVEVPAGAVFSGRLVADRTTVAAGMPIVSARYAGYGIVADIDGAQAYKIADSLGPVQAQITSGPGPFPCTVLGTIAALPEGTIPEPPADPNQPGTGQNPGQHPGQNPGQNPGQGNPSDPTGMRLVCTAPATVKLINGVSATIEVVTERASNALVLPVEAVAGSQGNGKVDVVMPDGSRQTKDVVLGLTDGKVIEIKSGLTGDETIAVPGPNLPPARTGGNGDNGKMVPVPGMTK